MAATAPGSGVLRSFSDERLAGCVRDGDERAFEALYDRHGRDLLAFCRHMLGTLPEAEDALQQTFTSAYRALRGDGALPANLRAWLFTIARNACISMLRVRRADVELADADHATEGLADVVSRRDDLRDLVGDLQRLPEDQRAALVLSELGGLDHDGIAAVLGVRREKVKALVFQAREHLAGLRAARNADCTAIREQLATATGAARRRGAIRRHVEVCPGCAAFEAEVRRQRAAMALILPVIPSAALKGKVLAAAFHGGTAAAGAATAAGTATLVGSGAATGAASGGTAATAGSTAAAAAGSGAGSAAGGGTLLAGKTVLAKALVAVAVAGGAGTGGYAVVQHHQTSRTGHVRSAPVSAPSATPATPAVPAAGGAAATPAVPATPSPQSRATAHRHTGAARPTHTAKAPAHGSRGKPTTAGGARPVTVAPGGAGGPKHTNSTQAAGGKARRPATAHTPKRTTRPAKAVHKKAAPRRTKATTAPTTVHKTRPVTPAAQKPATTPAPAPAARKPEAAAPPTTTPAPADTAHGRSTGGGSTVAAPPPAPTSTTPTTP